MPKKSLFRAKRNEAENWRFASVEMTATNFLDITLQKSSIPMLAP